MKNLFPVAITPEQLAAVQSGQGVAHVQDPNTQRIYLLIEQGLIEQGLIEQGQQPTLSDDYFREKLSEGLAESDRGESKPWDASELKDSLRHLILCPARERLRFMVTEFVPESTPYWMKLPHYLAQIVSICCGNCPALYRGMH